MLLMIIRRKFELLGSNYSLIITKSTYLMTTSDFSMEFSFQYL